MDRLLLHLLLLTWASVAAAGWLTSRTTKRLLVAGLLASGNLLATSLLLAAGHRFGDPAWFLTGSLLLAGATCLLAWRASGRSASTAGGQKDPPPAWPQWGLTLGFAPFAAALLVTAYLYAPTHPDASLPFNRGVVSWFGSFFGRPPAPPSGPGATLDPSAPFDIELVLAEDSRIKVSEGLQPTEGPFPLRNLPAIRWARQPSIRLTFFPPANPARLRLSFSLRQSHREAAVLEIFFNGRAVQQIALTDAPLWLDGTVELDPAPGENTIEFRDVTPDHEPDWLEYLERYPDVKNYLVAHNFPLEPGAREHYEISGRPEGRTIRLRAVPGPKDSRHFMFRNLRLQGGSSP